MIGMFSVLSQGAYWIQETLTTASHLIISCPVSVYSRYFNILRETLSLNEHRTSSCLVGYYYWRDSILVNQFDSMYE
jgi:hypothetical protein